MIAVSPRRGAAPRIGNPALDLNPRSSDRHRRPTGMARARGTRVPTLVPLMVRRGRRQAPSPSGPQGGPGCLTCRVRRIGAPVKMTSVSASPGIWQSPVDGLTSGPLEVNGGYLRTRRTQSAARPHGAHRRGAWPRAGRGCRSRPRLPARRANTTARTRPFASTAGPPELPGWICGADRSHRTGHGEVAVGIARERRHGLAEAAVDRAQRPVVGIPEHDHRGASSGILRP